MKKDHSKRMLFWVCALLCMPISIFAASSSSSKNISTSSQTLTIVRDSYGVPTISGGTFPEVCNAIGQVHAEDRLWQIFEAVIIANGNASAFFGPAFFDSDLLQRQINPSDAEVQNEIDLYLTENTKTVYTNYVDGLNAYIDVVNANPETNLPFEFAALGFDPPTNPVPYFSLYDIMRTARYVLQSFSTTQLPEYQLSNYAALETFTALVGADNALLILDDIDPTTEMIKSENTIVQNYGCGSNAKSLANSTSKIKHAPLQGAAPAQRSALATCAKNVSDRLKKIKAQNSKYVPKLGSNGQAISPKKSQSGNALLRMAPQPNYNHPSDFYEIRVLNNLFTADYFTIPGLPFGIGIYNNFGIAAQVGTLFTNDFLFEPASNIIYSRNEVIEVAGVGPVPIIVYRSSSGGWVIENPVPSEPGTILTLRTAFFGKQLQGLNLEGALPFTTSVKEFFKNVNIPGITSDMVGFQGQLADSNGDIGAYQATVWNVLPPEYDRRLPQGIPQNPAAPNSAYQDGLRNPQSDLNTRQGFYNGWNTTFNQDTPGTADTIDGGGPSLNRSYWLYNYLDCKGTVSFDELKYLTVVEAVANSITAFRAYPNEAADMFTPLFKKKFLRVLEKLSDPTADQARALKLLKSYKGQWFTGSELNIISTNDVSDKFILASTWLLCFAANILNPYLVGTDYEVAQSTVGDPLPNTNVEGSTANLFYMGQGNLLSRLLGTSYDNKVFFDGWLNGVDVDQVILNSLDQALTNLGGFAAFPWGANKRPIYSFDNAILGPLIFMKTFNASGLYLVAEFSKKGVERLEGVIPLGESGQVLVGPGFSPIFNAHSFDQQYLYVTFQTRSLPPFLKKKK